MTVWVVRMSPDGKATGEPRLCAKPGSIVREPGMPTVEEQIAILLCDNEVVDDADAKGRLKILTGNRLAGFIEVRDVIRAT